MSPALPLTLTPRLCDRCGACIKACPREALKVGRTYLKVDWATCDACGACARVCAPRAIVMRSAGGNQPVARVKPAARAAAQTPRSRSSAREKASGTAAPRRASAPPRGGKLGGFQWTLLEAIAMLSVTFSAFTLKETLTVAPVLPEMPESFDVPVRVGLLALYYLIQVAVLVWLVRRRGGDPVAALGLRRSGKGPAHALASAGLVLAGLVLTRLIASMYAYLTRAAGLMPSATSTLPQLFGADASGFVLAILLVVVVGPVVEEAVFRGALLEGMSARWGTGVALVAQALLFAAFHRSVWLLFPTFVLGLALGWLVERRKSLWPAIAMHSLYNALTVAAAFLAAAAV